MDALSMSMKPVLRRKAAGADVRSAVDRRAAAADASVASPAGNFTLARGSAYPLIPV